MVAPDVQVFSIDGRTLPPRTADSSDMHVLPSSAKLLSAHPAVPHVFLVGHSTGLVALHCVDRAAALCCWPCGEDLVALVWMSAGTGAFLAVHGDGAVARIDAVLGDEAVPDWTRIELASNVTSACVGSTAAMGASKQTVLLGSTAGSVCCSLHDLDQSADMAGEDLRRALLQTPG